MPEPAISVKSSPRRDTTVQGIQDRSPVATSAPQLAPSAGNLALQRLAAPRLQRKSRVSRRGDVYEEEADRVSEHVLTLLSAPMVQRKCACGGEGECDECRRKAAVQSADIHRKTDDLAVQRVPAGEETPGTTAAAGTADNSAATAPGAAPASSPGLIVEDNLTDLGTGQMKKSEFLGQLRGPVSTAAVAGLQGTVWSSLGTVAIEPWFLYYSRQSAQQLERSIQQSVPGSSGITSASAYIPLVSSRVQAAVAEWARTGKVPAGVPAGLPGIGLPGAGVLSTVSSLAQSAGDALSSVGSAIGGAVSGVAQGAQDVASSIGSGISSAAQGIGGALSDIGGMLFKTKDGGAHNAADPRAIQSQLGGGESLGGSLQSRMSSAFGYDFSSVRVHKDNRAAQLSSDLNARAFTIGNTVAFGANEYQPGTLVGDALIAHELAHVVQQGGATAPAPLQKGESETGALEDDADFSAVRAVNSLWGGAESGLANFGRNALPALRSGLKLRRCPPSARTKELERLGALQFQFLEEKRKLAEEKQRKEAEDAAKKAGTVAPAVKVDMDDFLKKETQVNKQPTNAWTSLSPADKTDFQNRANAAWAKVVASVKGMELENVVKGKTFVFNPETAIERSWYAWQSANTYNAGMQWVKDVEADPKNVWPNVAHELGGHFEYGKTYAGEIMTAALKKLPKAERDKWETDPTLRDQFYQKFEYPETEIFSMVRERRYAVPADGSPNPTYGARRPDVGIPEELKHMKDNLQPEVAKAVLQELKRRIDAAPEILGRDKTFFANQVNAVFGYTP